ncbi:MAG: hypothetical protein AAF387_20630 [Pseudomonadota bacterium]
MHKPLKFVLVASLLGFVTQTSFANDYPTLERVDHVLTCMRLAGGQSVDNLYACSCEIDVISQHVAFDDFTEARTYEIYKRMPGEKGGIFRESARADEIVAKLTEARDDAKKRCFIGKNRKKAATQAPAKSAANPSS